LDKLAQRMEVNGNRTPRSFAIKTLGSQGSAPFTVLRKTRVINPAFQGLSLTKAEVGTHGEWSKRIFATFRLNGD